MTDQPAQRTGGPVQPASGRLFIGGLVGILAMESVAATPLAPTIPRSSDITSDASRNAAWPNSQAFSFGAGYA